MITQADAEFHQADPTAFNWAETNFFIFSVPEAAISGCTYLLTRPNVGICHASIYVFQGLCERASDVLFTDAQMHLPCPASLLDYDLPNGLGTTVTRAPLDYHVRYVSQDQACKIDIEFKAIAEPYDIHNPFQNPLRGEHQDSAEAGGWGEAWSKGHFDLLGEMRGTLELDGESYRVSCIDAMDHSWGPRPEWEMRSIGWMMITFSPSLAFHLVCPIEIIGGEIRYLPMRFGHLCENGKVIGLVSAEVDAVSEHLLGRRRRIRVIDALGRKWEMFGEAIACAPWHVSYPSFITYTTLYRWSMDNRVGHSHIQDVFGVGALGRHSRGSRLHDLRGR